MQEDRKAMPSAAYEPPLEEDRIGCLEVVVWMAVIVVAACLMLVFLPPIVSAMQ
jgi:hypothetical protein